VAREGGTRRFLGAAAFLTLTAATATTVAGTGPVEAQEAPITVQVLATNDFHGRLRPDGANAGAAVMAGAVQELREAIPNTVFAAAGDLIGASTFESFIQQDQPTIDALNAAGLEVSAVGNHEFDQGYADLVDRVMAPYDPVTNPLGGAEWQYLGANVRNADLSPALPETWIRDFGEVQVGFVGAVTDHLDELVSPAGIAGLVIEEPVVAANRAAAELKAAGADIVILLVHEGAATTALESATDPTSDFGRIVNGASADIDAIVSGHTHLAYDHEITVPEWQAEGRAETERLVVSAGQYGTNLNQLIFEIDPETLEVTSAAGEILPLAGAYAPDPAVEAIVADAVAAAEVLGNQELGRIAGPFNRAARISDSTGAIEENRGAESTLGNLVAEVQRWATEDPTFGGAQIAFMNPGGLRADMVGNPPYPAVVTYRQAANVQPFANTLVNMQLTGAQLATVLEQQWQPEGAARPFLRLGISKGFTYTYDPDAPAGSRITGMWLHGEPIDPTASYSVTVNSFLAAGGDNFFEFANGANPRDTGQIDLQAMVDYLAEHTPADGSGIPVDFTQRSIGVSFPPDAPDAYAPGEEVTFTVSSLLLPQLPEGGPESRDETIAVTVDDVDVGTFPVDNTIPVGITDDEAGTATVSFAVPAGLAPGEHTITITGTTTGSTATVPLTVAVAGRASVTTLTASASSQVYHQQQPITFTAAVTVDGKPAQGKVEFVLDGTVVKTATLSKGTATYTLPKTTPAGEHTVTARYLGVPGEVAPSEASATVTVHKAASTTQLTVTRTTVRRSHPVVLQARTTLDNGEVPRGVIEFRDGDTVIDRSSSPVAVVTTVTTRNLSVGTHTFTATFVPADPANYTGNTSMPVVVQVTN
jgi:5'-nucleotidase